MCEIACTNPAVLVCLRCYNKIPDWMTYRQQGFIAHSSEAPTRSQAASFLLCPHMEEGGKGSF